MQLSWVILLVYITSFIATSCDLGESDSFHLFYWETVLLCWQLMNVITWLYLCWCLKWYGACRELTTVMTILLKLVGIVNFLIIFRLVYWRNFWFLCIYSGNMVHCIWSTVLVFCGFYLFDYRYFWDMEISSGVAHGSFISSIESMHITESIVHGFWVGTSVSHYFVLHNWLEFSSYTTG